MTLNLGAGVTDLVVVLDDVLDLRLHARHPASTLADPELVRTEQLLLGGSVNLEQDLVSYPDCSQRLGVTGRDVVEVGEETVPLVMVVVAGPRELIHSV